MSWRSLFGLRCLVGGCPATAEGDREWIWVRCVECGERSGHVRRAEIARYIELVERHEREKKP